MRFDRVVGTGGIGTGILFEMDSDRTLSRNETRLARLSPTRDYCKQHIILHYLARVLTREVTVYPIGLVGADDAGNGLLLQMREAGMDVSLVGQTPLLPTMYCVCIQYPDKAVCNVTTSKSACALVDATFIRNSLERLPRALDSRTVVVAAPEVPVTARLELLTQARAAGAFTAASFLVDEYAAFEAGGGCRLSDCVVINEDEAAACSGSDTPDMETRARTCYDILRAHNPGICLAMTCGAAGSYVCADGRVAHIPAQKARVIATGGAGDAYTAGLLCGLILGLPFMPGEVFSAPELGALLASESITEADTIAGHIDRRLVMGLIDAAQRKSQA